MNLKEKIKLILIELKSDNRTAYRVLKDAEFEIQRLEIENEELRKYKVAFFNVTKPIK